MSADTDPTAALAPPAAPPRRRSQRLAQTLAVFRLEVRRQLRGLGMVGLGILALLPVAPFAITYIVRQVTDGGPSLADTVQIYAGMFQGFLLPVVLFFGCVAAFTGLVRREVRERTLHHYLLCPLRRELLLVGKYLAGVAVTFAFFAAGSLLAYAVAFLQLLGPERFAVERFFLDGPGLGHLAAYLGVVLLGCAGYGAVFLAFALFVRSPIVPAFAVFAFEAASPFLPPALKKLSVFHYLHALCPVPIDQGPFAILAEPPPPWLAAPGLLALIAGLLLLSAWKMRRMDVAYGDE